MRFIEFSFEKLNGGQDDFNTNVWFHFVKKRYGHPSTACDGDGLRELYGA